MNLRVFVSQYCVGCEEAIAAAKTCADELPDVRVEVIDVDLHPEQVPPNVVAVPTYVLDGDVIHLGNPSPEWLADRLGAGRKGTDGEPRSANGSGRPGGQSGTS